MLKQLQAATGIIFAVFVAIHLFNTGLATFGAATYDGVQAFLRSGYQFPPVEALLLAALAVHMIVGVMRIVREPKRALNRRAKLHRYAGFFLLVVIAGHVLAVRGASWFYDIYPRFDGLAFSIDAVPGYFYPYYFLLGVTGFYHALNGLGIALTRLGMPLKVPPVLLRNATGIAAFVLTIALLALGGVLFDVGDLSQSAFGILATELVGDFAS